MKWYTDGAGWNGTVSRWAVANDGGFQRIFQKPDLYTNNQTEYFAMEEALKLASEGDEICSDSELVVHQLTGRYKVRDQKLKPPFAACMKLIGEKHGIKLTTIRREENLAGRLLEQTALPP